MKRRLRSAGLGTARAAAWTLHRIARRIDLGAGPNARLFVRRWAPRPDGWPRGRRLRIAALADLHACEPMTPLSRVRRIVEQTNALKADLIVLLGDFAADHPHVARPIFIDETAPILGALSARLGVYAVLGNHDWWDDRAAQARGAGPTRSHQALRAAGVRVLENDVVRLETPEGPFQLAGLGDQLAFCTAVGRRARAAGPGPSPAARLPDFGVDDLAAVSAQLDPDLPAILLAHEPDIFAHAPPGVALTLSGHTHGGQVRVLGWSPVSAFAQHPRYFFGLVEERGRSLVVSGGLGSSAFPVRLGVPPEITLVELG